MRTTAALASMVATAGAMAVVGWGLPGLDMAGPRPGTRIALVVPQLEVSVLFLAGLPLWSQTFAAERSPALRDALAVAPRGRVRALLRGVGPRLATVAASVAGGLIVWMLATFLGGGPSPASVLSTRLLILAFALFVLGVGAWVSARSRSAVWAAGAGAGAAALMAAAPFAIAPILSTFGTHGILVQTAVLVCPWVVAAGITGLDLVHMQWMYALSPLGHVEVSYLGLLTAASAYAAAGSVLLGASVRALRPVPNDKEPRQ